MIQLIKKIKLFFKDFGIFLTRRKNYKALRSFCSNPLFVRHVGYMPCGRCTGCRSYRFLFETQKKLEKIK